ncbi:MAG: DUF488 family protein [Promethearchaeia archaeon]
MVRNDIETFTIGHSNRSLEKMLNLLESHHIDVVVDVRRLPHSPRNPHFNRKNLREALAEEYIHYKCLGD